MTGILADVPWMEHDGKGLILAGAREDDRLLGRERAEGTRVAHERSVNVVKLP